MSFAFRLYAVPYNFMEENEVIIIDKEQGIFAGDKYYISADQLILLQDGMFVMLEEVPVPIGCVMQDSQGIYCVVPNCSSKTRSWKCPRRDCGTWNGAWRIRCQRCGRERPAGSVEN